ncbi:MAG: hypothetical protein FWF29_07060 [Treponema sp.]|nr:hypothetical protein [Treponema sp.]
MPPYDTAVRAEFERMYTVTASMDPADGGTVGFRNVSGIATTEFAQGDTVTVLATPAPGYQTQSISVGGTVISGNTFTMPGGNVTVAVSFAKQKYTAYAVSDGSGHLYLIPPGSDTGSSIVTAEMGDKIVLDIIPASGFQFDIKNFFCTTAEMDTVDIQYDADNDCYFIIMPSSNVTVNAVFDKRVFTLNPQVIRESADTESNITLSTLAPQAGEVITVTVTPKLGYELQSLNYYLVGSDTGTAIDKFGTNYAFSIGSDAADGATFNVVAVFGIISHKLSVDTASSDGATYTFYINNKLVSNANYNDTVTAYLIEKSNAGYTYKDQSFKVYTTGGTSVALTSSRWDDLGKRYVFVFSMPNSSVIISAEFTRYTYNLIPTANIPNGKITITSLSAGVPIGDTVTFTAVPNEGYQVLSTGFVLMNGSTQVRSATGFNPTDNPNEYSFVMGFTVSQVPSNNSTVSITGQFALGTFTLLRDPAVTGVTITLSHSQSVIYGSTVTITLARTASSRYKLGSVTLNNGADDSCFLGPEAPNSDGNYTRSFKMPAKTIVVSALSEPIPLATIDVNDPNMDQYIHFLDGNSSVAITSAVPGALITVEAFIPDYPGAPPDAIGAIPLTVQSWWLDNTIQTTQDPRYFTIPDPCLSRMVTAIVTIGGKPYSVSIPIRLN